MKVYFAPCGIGLGHAGRILAVAKELKKILPDCKFYFSTYGKAHEFIKRYHYFNETLQPLQEIMWAENEKGIDVKETLRMSKDIISRLRTHYRIECRNIERIKPDIVVSDSRYTPLLAAGKYEIPRIFIANQINFILPKFTFSEIIARLASLLNWKYLGKMEHVFAPDLPPPYTISRYHLNTVKNLEIEYVGFCIRKRPEELPSQYELKKKYREEDRFLVYASLSGPSVTKRDIADIVAHIFPDLWDTDVVIVTGEPGKRELIPRQHVLRINWLRERYEMLKACDLVIARCGHNIISENVVYCKKGIYIPEPNQKEQELNARMVSYHDIGIVMYFKYFYTYALIKNIRVLRSDPVFERRLKIIHEVAKKYIGERTIAEKIAKIIS